MEGLVMTAQIILSLSILVGLHEGGHLLAAKAFGMRVEQFSIGFPPKLFSFKWGETEYALSAIPLGGFVKISGMIDESLDTEAMKEPPKEYEFRAKPAWQRLIVMLGGIIVNVITGVIIFISLTYIFGDTYISKDAVNAKGGIVAYELAEEIGLKTGDKIVKINGQEFDDFQDLIDGKVFLADDAYYTVERDGKLVDVQIPGNFIENLNDEDAMARFIFPRFASVVGKVGENTLAERVGITEGDRILEISGTKVAFQDEVIKKLKGYDQDSIHLKVQRGDEILTFNEYFKNDTIIGYIPALDFDESTINYDLGQSITIGTQRAFGIVFLQIKAFGKMFSGELSVTKSLSGPIGIAKAYGGTWDWQRFWRMTGLLSMVLAFMNLLPIPALDGGHVMFLSYEIISGKKPSDGFLESAQKVGMVFLLLLMVFIIFNDIFKIEFIKDLFGLN
ncbi:RIP metalloprotease RseP [Fulvivirga sp. M361]|uniref:RIP metalloprotease RseP n=1 Tax=Fulvivirga sp. M361 TaxID=2594266 RepID=UPI00117B595F|nr:RIP metalloprotease RseP [Fulvivirga sp. M361]TRX56255.1 RIP metalloprotease RseP [Fulvivirga sp. M361]